MRGIHCSLPRVTLGEADPNLTPRARLRLVAELDRVLGVAPELDREIGETRVRRRRLSSERLLLSRAETTLAGWNSMVEVDSPRADGAGRPLRPVAEIPASSTFIGRAKRFGDAVFSGIERANAELVGGWLALLPGERRAELATVRPTIDVDPTDVGVNDPTKEGVAWTTPASASAGPIRRCGRRRVSCSVATSAREAPTPVPLAHHESE